MFFENSDRGFNNAFTRVTIIIFSINQGVFLIAINYFASQNASSFVNALSDSFLTYSDLSNNSRPYVWNFVLAGHGGSTIFMRSFKNKS